VIEVSLHFNYLLITMHWLYGCLCS